ncbi:hypothetical protein DE146DRAFT_786096 [Phaeosphaeria sp. MPI-PUGE-AT-0046c]|nr:hypothetical protein DE146DRAFT_786096 [Phaeosphaeria sp. MPI-PUGE-AT-0046c]
MSRFHIILAFGAMLASSNADIFTLSLGDVGQYSAALASPPTMTGSRVLFTDAAGSDGGVDVVLSQDLQATMKTVLDNNCITIDNGCIDSVRNLLVSPQTELESRQAVAVVYAVGALIGLVSLTIPLWEERNHGVPAALHIPQAQIGPAASAASAATMAAVTESGAPFVTITPRPSITRTAGPDKPMETILTSPQDGHEVGDVAIQVTEDLATRLTEMINRSQQCPAPQLRRSPTNAHKGTVTREEVNDQIFAIICAAKSLVLNAVSGGPFAELSLIKGQQPAWISPDLAQAMGDVASFAISQSSFLQLNDIDAATLGYVSFYLAFMVIRNKTPLGRMNWIVASEFNGVVTASPTKGITITPTNAVTSTSTSSLLECSASCTMVGQIRACNTQYPTPTDDDSFTKPTTYAVKTVVFEPWVVPLQIPVSIPIGVCPPPPGNATDFPLDGFRTVYSKFCSENGKSTTTATWVVNAKGEQVGPKSRLLRYATRANAAEDDKYKDYRFTLAKVVREGEPFSCATTCEKAFERLSGQDLCKRGEDKKAIADTGFLDAGCAAYSFMIEAPKPPEVEVEVEVKCGDSKGRYSAPKYDSEAAGAISVESAIKKWCAESHDFYLNHEKDNNQKYGRWDITQLDVPKRSSFWARATVHDPKQNGIIKEKQCVAAFTNGLKQCDAESGRTHGFSAVGILHGTNILRSEDEARNGGTSARDPFGPMCDKHQADFNRIFPNDLEATIDSFCVEGIRLKPFHGAGGDDRYPKKGNPRFYESGFLKMFLSLGAEPMNRGGKERPYFDDKACEGYDFKMRADDCRYALRKLFKECNTKPEHFNAGEYKYRCVRYKVYPVNET